MAKDGALLAHCRTVLERGGALLSESRVLFVGRCGSKHRDGVVFLRGNRAHLAKDGALLAICRVLVGEDRALLAEDRALLAPCGLFWKKMGRFGQRTNRSCGFMRGNRAHLAEDRALLADSGLLLVRCRGGEQLGCVVL